MNEISCNVIKDILPLYIDGVVSDDSKRLLDRHLANCEKCRKEADILRSSLVLPSSPSVELSEAQHFKRLKKKLNIRRLFIILIALLLIVTLGMGTVLHLNNVDVAVAYDRRSIEVQEVSGEVYVGYSGNSQASLCKLYANTDETIVIVYFVETRWDALIGSQNSFGVISNVVDSDDCSAIYYGDFSAYDEPETHLSEFTLIWENSDGK